MPIYSYHCMSCEHDWPEYFHMSSLPPEDQHVMCPTCRITAGKRVPSAPHTHRDFEHPIYHYSCAVNSVEEAKAIAVACPDIQICLDFESEDFGVPISRNQTAKEQLQRFTGYTDTEKRK